MYCNLYRKLMEYFNQIPQCTPTIFPAEPFDDDVALATANALYSLYSTEVSYLRINWRCSWFDYVLST